MLRNAMGGERGSVQIVRSILLCSVTTVYSPMLLVLRGDGRV